MSNSPSSILPVELWIKIALVLRDNFPCEHGVSSIDGDLCTFFECPLKDVRAVMPLTESCKYFRDVVQPLVYGGILLDPRFANDTARLTSTLSTRPDLGSSVHTLQIYAFQPRDTFKALLEVLPRLVEVRFLSITHSTIDAAIVKLLHNATNLRTLRMRECTWEEDVPENWSDSGRFGENLTELILDSGSESTHQFSKTIQLFVPTLRKIQSDFLSIVHFMKSSRSSSFGNSLVHLVTDVQEPDHQLALIQLLSQCPNITHLEANGALEARYLTADLLPNLQSIKAGDSVVSALLPGRAIRSISMAPGIKVFSTPLPELEVLRLHTTQGWEGSFGTLHGMLAACPRLIRLEMASDDPTDEDILPAWIETHLLPEIHALPRLQILHIKWHDMWTSDEAPTELVISEEMEREREMIIDIKRQHCPDLYDAWLQPSHAWTYVQADKVWVPRIRIYRS